MPDNTFKCCVCGGTFEKAWSDEEAIAEMKQEFDKPVEECDVVCDDCYEKLMQGKQEKMKVLLSEIN